MPPKNHISISSTNPSNLVNIMDELEDEVTLLKGILKLERLQLDLRSINELIKMVYLLYIIGQLIFAYHFHYTCSYCWLS